MSAILCIGSESDRTFSHTLGRLRAKGLPLSIVDLASILIKGRIHIDWPNRSCSLMAADQCWHINDFRSAYVRAYDISAGAPDTITRDRCLHTFVALATGLRVSNIERVVGRSRDLSNLSKVFHSAQLSPLARTFGVGTPETMLTNNPASAQEFLRKHESVICKGASAFKSTARLLDGEDYKRLGLVKNCPTLFQRCIPGPDIRVHAVSERCFAEAIFCRDIDYRFSSNKSHALVDIPANIKDFCVELTVALGCPFLGIDFKVHITSGKWYFLEANSMPAYQGYDKRAGGAISSALADYLTNV